MQAGETAAEVSPCFSNYAPIACTDEPRREPACVTGPHDPLTPSSHAPDAPMQPMHTPQQPASHTAPPKTSNDPSSAAVVQPPAQPFADANPTPGSGSPLSTDALHIGTTPAPRHAEANEVHSGPVRRRARQKRRAQSADAGGAAAAKRRGSAPAGVDLTAAEVPAAPDELPGPNNNTATSRHHRPATPDTSNHRNGRESEGAQCKSGSLQGMHPTGTSGRQACRQSQQQLPQAQMPAADRQPFERGPNHSHTAGEEWQSQLEADCHAAANPADVDTDALDSCMSQAADADSQPCRGSARSAEHPEALHCMQDEPHAPAAHAFSRSAGEAMACESGSPRAHSGQAEGSTSAAASHLALDAGPEPQPRQRQAVRASPPQHVPFANQRSGIGSKPAGVWRPKARAGAFAESISSPRGLAAPQQPVARASNHAQAQLHHQQAAACQIPAAPVPRPATWGDADGLQPGWLLRAQHALYCLLFPSTPVL